MKGDGSWIAGVAAIMAVLGVTALPNRHPSTPAAAEAGRPPTLPSEKAAGTGTPSDACEEIEKRVGRFLLSGDRRYPKLWYPRDCYSDTPAQQTAPPINSPPSLYFAIATVPNPITTHLALQFDRVVEAIQQAAQDNHYSYDDSWFPWRAAKEYPLFDDQEKEDDQRKTHESQPGVMVFRRDSADTPPYSVGLIVFLVGEKPTGGIGDGQFDSAIEWIQQLGGFSTGVPLRILGPSFSGSLPSLERDLRRNGWRLGAGTPVYVSSGSVSSGNAYPDFSAWIATWENHAGSDFRTAFENDALMADRFCQYLGKQGYDTDRVAFLSEDETAFGAANAVEGDSDRRRACAGAVELHYPRDIATLRSAYEEQAILGPARPQGANAPSTTLRSDLSEPANGDHDTVRTYAGQLTSLTQEAILLDITNRLRDAQAQFVVVRSTSSLDEIFLGEFLHRAYSQGRVVLDGADLLFTRGAEGGALRGTMVLSTYPLLTQEKDWAPPLLMSKPGDRSFGNDMAEGEYIAARELFSAPRCFSPDPACPIPSPIEDYTPPGWSGASGTAPATWLTVVGRRQFWPIAALSEGPSVPIHDLRPILKTSEERSFGPPLAVPSKDWLPVPTALWMLAGLCVLLSWAHYYFCKNGARVGTLRAFAYFAPLPGKQHPALVVLGSALVATLAVDVAASSGLLSWFGAGPHVPGSAEKLLLAAALLLAVFNALRGCAANYRIAPLQSSASGSVVKWRGEAMRAGLLFLGAFVLFHMYEASRLTRGNFIPTYWRSMNLFSGVSPLLPEAILIVGAYLWFWCNLRGLAHFGDGQPVLPKEADLPMFPPRSPRDKLQSAMKVFSQEGTGISVESEARPLSRAYLKRLAAFLGASTLVCRVSLGGVWVPTLGEWEFGALIFGWVCLYVALVLADTYQVWKAWNELRQLLIRLDRLALRRTLRGLKGIAWGSIWGIGENVLEARYRMISLERESLSHLKNAMPADVWNALPADAHETLMTKVDAAFVEYARWYVTLTRGALVGDLKRLHELQGQFAQAAGMVLQHILVPAWQKESDSLIYEDPGGPAGQESPKAPDLAAGTPHQVPPHVRAAEEFFVLPYLAFVQNILGRIRTAILGVVWLFVAVALAVSSYPFEPSNTLAAIFLAVFLIVAGVMTVVYAQMSRDATLSHVTDTKPGELGWAFWTRMLAFGAGPLVALVATWFPAVADFAFSWLQPSVQALR